MTHDDSPPICPTCGQPASDELGDVGQGWECSNEACPEFGQPISPDEPRTSGAAD
jgi:hypothetical protein